MNSPSVLLQCFLFLSLTSSTLISAKPARLSLHREPLLRSVPAAADSKKLKFKNFLYPQTLDHFNYNPQSYVTFNQRYVICDKYWGGSNASAPIFVFLGEEQPLDDDLAVVGFLNDNAPHFKALIVFIEHRFYGKSVPYGLPMNESTKNATVRGFFNSAQAIADYAEIITHIKKTLSATYSPVIVIGGSYGGMLASWFRMKYPHVALGALASSAPILYFEDLTPQNGYYSVVTRDFREASENCYQTIRKLWSEIDRVASKPHGLSILSRKFNTCSPLTESYELKDYMDSVFASAAQYNDPPTYPVRTICDAIDSSDGKTDVLGRVFAGLVAYKKRKGCFDMNSYSDPNDQTNLGWGWQTCSDMVIPIGRGSNDTMFPAAPFNLTEYVDGCRQQYGVTPRPHWITSYFGGHDIKLILHRFASNIIFSNGLRDPYSSGGVLENLSDSILAVYAEEGPHCLDILFATKKDPDWLVKQRKREVEIIEGWIKEYFVDLHSRKLISFMPGIRR